MGNARGFLANTVVKLVATTAAALTSEGTMTAYPVDLDSVATGQRPTWCKIVFAGMKTGTATLAHVVITPLTGTTVTCNTGMAAFPASTYTAGDIGSGAVAAAGTVETGRFVKSYDIDLANSQVRTWLGCTALVTATTDSFIGTVTFIFGGFKELPVTNTAMATMA